MFWVVIKEMTHKIIVWKVYITSIFFYMVQIMCMLLHISSKLTTGGSMVKLKNIAQPILSLGSEQSSSMAVIYVKASFTAIITC